MLETCPTAPGKEQQGGIIIRGLGFRVQGLGSLSLNPSPHKLKCARHLYKVSHSQVQSVLFGG